MLEESSESEESSDTEVERKDFLRDNKRRIRILPDPPRPRPSLSPVSSPEYTPLPLLEGKDEYLPPPLELGLLSQPAGGGGEGGEALVDPFAEGGAAEQRVDAFPALQRQKELRNGPAEWWAKGTKTQKALGVAGTVLATVLATRATYEIIKRTRAVYRERQQLPDAPLEDVEVKGESKDKYRRAMSGSARAGGGAGKLQFLQFTTFATQLSQKTEEYRVNYLRDVSAIMYHKSLFYQRETQRAIVELQRYSANLKDDDRELLQRAEKLVEDNKKALDVRVPQEEREKEKKEQAATPAAPPALADGGKLVNTDKKKPPGEVLSVEGVGTVFVMDSRSEFANVVQSAFEFKTRRKKKEGEGGESASKALQEAIGTRRVTLQRLMKLMVLSRFLSADEGKEELKRRFKAFVAFVEANKVDASTRPEIWAQMLGALLKYWGRPEPGPEDRVNYMIRGPPGVGKSYMAKSIVTFFRLGGIIIGSSNSIDTIEAGAFKNSHFGESERLAADVLESHLEDGLFIDEAHMLGDENPGSTKKAVFSQIMRYLGDHPRGIVSVLAGYKEDIEVNLYGMEPGAKRRFVNLDIAPYTPMKLQMIFFQVLTDTGITAGRGKKIRYIRRSLRPLLRQLFHESARCFPASAASVYKLLSALEDITTQLSFQFPANPLPLTLTRRVFLMGVRHYLINTLVPRPFGEDWPNRPRSQTEYTLATAYLNELKRPDAWPDLKASLRKILTPPGGGQVKFGRQWKGYNPGVKISIAIKGLNTRGHAEVGEYYTLAGDGDRDGGKTFYVSLYNVETLQGRKPEVVEGGEKKKKKDRGNRFFTKLVRSGVEEVVEEVEDDKLQQEQWQAKWDQVTKRSHAEEDYYAFIRLYRPPPALAAEHNKKKKKKKRKSRDIEPVMFFTQTYTKHDGFVHQSSPVIETDVWKK